MKSIITADELRQVLEILGLPGETLSFEVGGRGDEVMTGHRSSWRMKAVIGDIASGQRGCVDDGNFEPYQTRTVYVPVLLRGDKTPEQVNVEFAERQLQLAEGAIKPGQSTLKVDVCGFIDDVTAAAASYRAANKFGDDVEVNVNPPAWVRRQLTDEVIAALGRVNVKLETEIVDFRLSDKTTHVVTIFRRAPCNSCATGDIEHERTAECWETHSPWKECGVECCVVDDDVKLLGDDRGGEYLGH